MFFFISLFFFSCLTDSVIRSVIENFPMVFRESGVFILLTFFLFLGCVNGVGCCFVCFPFCYVWVLLMWCLVLLFHPRVEKRDDVSPYQGHIVGLLVVLCNVAVPILCVYVCVSFSFFRSPPSPQFFFCFCFFSKWQSGGVFGPLFWNPISITNCLCCFLVKKCNI